MHCTGYLYTANELFSSKLLFPEAFVKSNAVNDEMAADLLACMANRTVVAPVYKQVFAIEDPCSGVTQLLKSEEDLVLK